MPKPGTTSNAKHKGTALASLRTAFEVLKAVQTQGRLTQSQLAEHVGLSAKQVGRYLDVLEEFGVWFARDEQDRRLQPLRLSTAVREVKPPFNALFLDRHELVLLYAYLAGLHHAGDAATRERLWNKVRQHLAADRIDAAQVQSALGSFDKAYKSYDGKRDIVAALLQALYRNLVCAVTYATPQTTAPRTYDIEPYELVEFDGGLYLYCWVPHHENVILLAVERIQALRPDRERSFVRSEAVLAEIRRKKARAFRILDDGCVFDVALRFSPQAAFYAAERIWHPTQQLTPHPDGSVTLTFRASGRIEIERWIRMWGDEVEVLRMEPTTDEDAAE